MKRQNSAFTLLELLAASALAAVLMLVLFQVIGSLGRTRAAMTDVSLTPWKSDLLEVLRWDFANADSIKLDPGRATVTGHGSLDRRTLAAAHEPVTVVYELDAGRLIRRQFPRASATGERGWSEIVCANVSRFEVAATTRGERSCAVRVVLLDTAGRSAVDEVIVVN